MLACLSILWLLSLCSAGLDQVVGQRGWLHFSMSLHLIACVKCRKRPGCLIDLLCVVFANMHILAGSFSKPHLFSPSKACGGCFSLGTDSKVMYGKSYLNICIQLGNTLVLECYPGRLSKKGVFVGLDFAAVILNYCEAGRAVCEADKWWHWSHVEDLSRSLRTSITDQHLRKCRFGS